MELLCLLEGHNSNHNITTIDYFPCHPPTFWLADYSLISFSGPSSYTSICDIQCDVKLTKFENKLTISVPLPLSLLGFLLLSTLFNGISTLLSIKLQSQKVICNITESPVDMTSEHSVPFDELVQLGGFLDLFEVWHLHLQH